MSKLTNIFQRKWVWLMFLAIAGILVAGIFMIGGAAALAWTNTEAFCIGCHEMKNNVYAEYKGTIHDQNRTGVRAICSDCHVPKEPVAMVKRKIQASLELYGHFISKSIDTPEKFEAKRHELATHVWKRMQETDSVECRNCHNESKMSKELQTPKAQARHAKGKLENLTCIDCHFDIAHKEPDGPGPRELALVSSK